MKINMTQGSIKTLEVFCDTIKTAMEAIYETDYKVVIKKVNKNNSMELTGITISNNSNKENITPIIYLNGFYEDYQNGTSLEKICKEITFLYENNKITFDINCVTDFEKVKNNICYKIINTEKNRKLLENTPHIEIEDLSIVFYILIDNKKDIGDIGSVTIKNDMLNYWNIGIRDLKKIAFNNTQNKLKASINSMRDTLLELTTEDIGDEIINFVDENRMPIYVCSNNKRINGASVILYKGLLKSFSDKLNSDFYILPSSIHEIILIPANIEIKVKHLKEMVKDVNTFQVAEEDILSDNVYYYNRLTNKISIAQ